MSGVYALSGIPSDLMSSDVEFERRLKVSSTDYVDAAIEGGDYFAAFLQRTNISANSIYFFHVTASPTHDIIIDAITPSFDLSRLSSGSMTYRTALYFSESDGNSFAYADGSAPSSFGRSMNGYFINKLSQSKLSAGGSASPTGAADFVTLFATYFLEANGNNRSLTTSGSDFFTGSKKLIVKAGTSVLFLSETIGNVTGLLDVTTQVSFFERAI